MHGDVDGTNPSLCLSLTNKLIIKKKKKKTLLRIKTNYIIFKSDDLTKIRGLKILTIKYESD